MPDIAASAIGILNPSPLDNKQKISELKIKLKEAISQQDFETAIKLRDELKSFE